MRNSQKINADIVRKLILPKKSSHKGQNGRLLVVAGSEKYHGSLLYAIKAAAKIVDLVYVLTTKENQKLVRKLKSKTASFIPIHNVPFTPSYLQRGEGELFDCILIGPGMGASRRTYNLVKAVLKSGIRAVLDADALNVLNARLLRLLGPQHILTPHQQEFKRVFGVAPNLTIVRNEATRHKCAIVLKGKVDILVTPSHSPPIRRTGGENKRIRVAFNSTGNEGMTKGGTGDVLAGLIAAFYTKNDGFISAAASVYLNGLAGDELYKKVGPYFDAEDLIEQIPKTLWRLLRN